MDYEKKIREYMVSSKVDQLYKSMLINLFPELAESEDEKIKKELISHLHDTLDVCTGKNADLVKKWIAWLEKQGEQKPVEWSEEDEDDILHICCWLNEYGNLLLGKSEDKSNRIFKTVDRLKSLRPQNRWKPSKEQLQALRWVCNRTFIVQEPQKESVLEDLYEQLKAL